ncbi:probable E3 ubiquitin-protein ligase XERICO [Eucalyptus grandis]|uniref:probable E3 ubiquitin-protein ligase XERICO n=1 Tax=Eucalyptus grandis TaxID=71139 RepID=UPI00192F10ED|nr:probable E3 ubiquitin-protein ligase XERICO [Eucalyptus grandis]
MGLSSFPVAAEGLLPLLVMNAALSVSHVKSTWRYLLDAIAGGVAASASAAAEAGTPRPLSRRRRRGGGGGGAARRRRRRRRVRVRRFETPAGSECGGSCCVCLCRFEAEEEVSELDCKHFFHRECLARWFDNGHRTCPLCRSVL